MSRAAVLSTDYQLTPNLRASFANCQQSSSQRSTTVIIEEFEPDVFRQLIEYIHTGCVLLQARTLLGELRYPFFGFAPELTAIECTARANELTLEPPRSPAGLLNAADYYGLEQLRRACLRFVSCCITVDTGKWIFPVGLACAHLFMRRAVVCPGAGGQCICKVIARR